MDEQLERLRRAVARDPVDRVQAVRYAGALERAGRFTEAWELLDGINASEELTALAGRNPLPVLERIRQLDYRRARLLMEQLRRLGLSRHPAIVFLASATGVDEILKMHAAQSIAVSLELELGEEPIPAHRLGALLENGGFVPNGVANHPAAQPLRDHIVGTQTVARVFARRVLEQSERASSIAMLPWLMPLLTAGDPELAAGALEAVRRLLHCDGPPLDADLLTQLLARHQGEPA